MSGNGRKDYMELVFGKRKFIFDTNGFQTTDDVHVPFHAIERIEWDYVKEHMIGKYLCEIMRIRIHTKNSKPLTFETYFNRRFAVGKLPISKLFSKKARNEVRQQQKSELNYLRKSFSIILTHLSKRTGIDPQRKRWWLTRKSIKRVFFGTLD